LRTIDGLDQCVVRFTTDIPYLTRWGIPLLFGPGSILNAHTDHEFVEKRELAQAVDIYARLARALLAGAPDAREALGETREGAAR
jgi:acetylornithine deacetylase